VSVSFSPVYYPSPEQIYTIDLWGIIWFTTSIEVVVGRAKL
jgi:hypothetical protein